MRVILVITTGLMVVAAIATALGRDLITRVYGDDYAAAARILPPLVAACIAWAVTSVYLTEARVLHRDVDTVLITVALTTAILVPALLLVPDDGLDGATVSFVIGNIAAAVVAGGCHIWHRDRALIRTPDDPTLAEDLVLHP